MGEAVELYDGQLDGAPPLMPEGEYTASYIRHETAYIYKSPKVFVHFRIHGGDHDGQTVYRAYRVKELRDKRPRKNGSFKLRHSQELYRQLVMLSGQQERPDRVSLRRLKGCMLRISVRTVTHDSRQRNLPDVLRYSVVDRIIALEAGEL